MINYLRIGGITINPRQVCYAREGLNGDLYVFMSCGQVLLRGAEAEALRSYISQNSQRLAAPQLPQTRKYRRA